MARVEVQLTVPFPGSDGHGDAAIIFTHWLPRPPDEVLTAVVDGIPVILGFDFRCTRAISITEPELVSWNNVTVYETRVTATVAGIPQPLADYMRARKGTSDIEVTELTSGSPDAEYRAARGRSLDAEYRAIGDRVHHAVLTTVNRLIAYARSEKGQYWVSLHRIDLNQTPSFFSQREAQARIDAGEAFPFRPPGPFVVYWDQSRERRYIAKESWSALADYVSSDRRADLVLTLLADAEDHADQEHRRAALTEAVTALEVAISRFARSPRADAAFGPTLAARLATNTLAGQVKHMGLTGSVLYLLPAIVPESVLPSDVLRLCQEAVNKRGSVVHDGQRTVDARWLTQALASIREMCRVLVMVSEPGSQEDGES